MRFGCLLFLFPFVEFALLLLVGSWIGGWEVVGLVAGMALVGITLVQREARRLRGGLGRDLARGGAPSRSVLNSVAALAAGFLFMVPGFLTDIAAFLLLFPLTRRLFSRWIQAMLLAGVARGGMRVMTWGRGMGGAGESGPPFGGGASRGTSFGGDSGVRRGEAEGEGGGEKRPPRPGEIIQ